VIGFGINVNQKKFPPELEGIATSLYIDTKDNKNINNLFNEIIEKAF
jgi:BirA family biotin operon repressor/biotin-[acetyl-CoA-carboxylase] ligase